MAYVPGIPSTDILTCWCWHHPGTTSTATPLRKGESFTCHKKAAHAIYPLLPQQYSTTHPLLVPVAVYIAKFLSQQEVERIYRCFNESATAKEINSDARPSIS